MRWFIFLFLVVTALSCSDDSREIKVYRLAKGDSSLKSPHVQELKEAPFIPRVESPKISWMTPSEWKEHSASGMRTGSFSAENRMGLSVDISAIYLEGQAGGNLPNVNRWREQIGLASWSFTEFDSSLVVVETPLGSSKVVDFSSRDKRISNQFHERIVAAIIPFKGGTWFFKMVGEESYVEEHKPVFFQFLSSLRSSAS